MTETESRSSFVDGDRDLGYRIVTEVARREGTDPIALDAPLYEAVNVDALAALVDSASADATVSFRYLGFDVTVDGDGSVTVDGDGSVTVDVSDATDETDSTPRD